MEGGREGGRLFRLRSIGGKGPAGIRVSILLCNLQCWMLCIIKSYSTLTTIFSKGAHSYCSSYLSALTRTHIHTNTHKQAHRYASSYTHIPPLPSPATSPPPPALLHPLRRRPNDPCPRRPHPHAAIQTGVWRGQREVLNALPPLKKACAPSRFPRGACACVPCVCALEVPKHSVVTGQRGMWGSVVNREQRYTIAPNTKAGTHTCTNAHTLSSLNTHCCAACSSSSLRLCSVNGTNLERSRSWWLRRTSLPPSPAFALFPLPLALLPLPFTPPPAVPLEVERRLWRVIGRRIPSSSAAGPSSSSSSSSSSYSHLYSCSNSDSHYHSHSYSYY